MSDTNNDDLLKALMLARAWLVAAALADKIGGAEFSADFELIEAAIASAVAKS